MSDSKTKRGIWTKYALEGAALSRKSVFCPRCGKGFVMADHENRYTCGNCHYTQFKQREAA